MPFPGARHESRQRSGDADKPERGARKSPEEIEVVHKPGFVGGAAIGAIEVILFAGLALVGVPWRSIA
jgi:hypothetical protein